MNYEVKTLSGVPICCLSGNTLEEAVLSLSPTLAPCVVKVFGENGAAWLVSVGRVDIPTVFIEKIRRSYAASESDG